MIKIDYRDARPIYEQIVDGVENLALRGALPAGSQLPSVRQLAMELSINPNTIQRAYAELERRGVIYSAKGRGNFISDDTAALRQRRLDEIAAQIHTLAVQAHMLGATDEEMRRWLEEGEEKA